MDESQQSESHSTDYNKNKEVTITFNREKVINSIVVVELVLLLVFGWQLYGIKQQLKEVKAGQYIDQGPIVKNDDAPIQPSPTEATGPVDITIGDDEHIRGDKNAPVTIVEYSDFECPFCARAFPTITQVLDDYEGDVRLVYRHFPLSFHPQAQKAGEASECASDQGKFWEYHDLVFNNQSLLNGGINQLKTWAGELGLDQSRFDKCLDSGDHADDVKNDQISGTSAGVTGTPAFFINGIKITGAQPYSVFQQAIDAELAK